MDYLYRGIEARHREDGGGRPACLQTPFRPARSRRFGPSFIKAFKKEIFMEEVPALGPQGFGNRQGQLPLKPLCQVAAHREELRKLSAVEAVAKTLKGSSLDGMSEQLIGKTVEQTLSKSGMIGVNNLTVKQMVK